MALITRRKFIGAVGAATLLGTGAQAAGLNYAEREEVRIWAAETSEKYGLPFEWVLKSLGRARYSGETERIMSRPKLTATNKPKNWLQHKEQMVNAERILKGRRFLQTNDLALRAAWQRWTIPPEIITAVIGIETIYGKSMGRHRVVDVLSTLSFDYKRRAAYFQNELAVFLALCYTRHENPRSIFGSFAGAIGMCQFMPSNIVKLGVDLDGDGVVNLRTSPTDAIGSVANYLATIGWNNELPIVWECEADDSLMQELSAGGLTPNTTLQNALDAGVEVLEWMNAPGDTEVLLIDLPTVDKSGKPGNLWRLGTKNFSTLLDYNRSYFYAESVRELALAIRSNEKTGDWRETLGIFF